MPPAPQPTFATLSRGDLLPTVDLTITTEDVQAYLEATGASAPRWWHYVPPLMLDARMLAILLEQVELPPGLMHTGHEHEARRPVHIGEPLVVQFSVASNAVRNGALFAVFDAEARAGDEVVSVLRASVMSPAAPAAADGGAA
ncbi:MAG: hypothetical protein WD734_04595 [Dehalococcoidia bacterium]